MFWNTKILECTRFGIQKPSDRSAQCEKLLFWCCFDIKALDNLISILERLHRFFSRMLTWRIWDLKASRDHLLCQLGAKNLYLDDAWILKSSISMVLDFRSSESNILTSKNHTSGGLDAKSWYLHDSWMLKPPSFAVGLIPCISVWNVRRVTA